MIRINGQTHEGVSARDRGLAYGDGVFRTMRLTPVGVAAWDWQYAVLREDAGRLGLVCAHETVWLDDIAALAKDHGPGVIKCMLTRGSASRGYAWPTSAVETRVVCWSPATVYPDHWYTQGITARMCRLRLGLQPALAGIKHLNRLENVLARAEWQAAHIVEGILQDSEGRLIGGVMSNLFWLTGGVWHTPALGRAGVAGVTRRRILALLAKTGQPAVEVDAPPSALFGADEAFICNSLMGIVPLAVLDAREWRAFPLSMGLRQDLEGRE